MFLGNTHDFSVKHFRTSKAMKDNWNVMQLQQLKPQTKLQTNLISNKNCKLCHLTALCNDLAESFNSVSFALIMQTATISKGERRTS